MIVKIGPSKLIEAVARLVATGSEPDLTHSRRFLDYARTNQIKLDFMWSRLDESGQVHSTVLAVPSPGRTAMVFASRCVARGDAEAMSGLIDHAARELADEDIHLAQSLLEPTERRERDIFLRGGFTELATLSYLERVMPKTYNRPLPTWPEEVTTETYRENARDEVVTLLDATYEGTLDCPELFGLRKTEDILEGHRATGRFEADLWTILRFDGRPSGLLLLNPSPASNSIELVYIGLAPWARGRGLGRQLLRHGLALLAGRAERTISLAVDDRNTPALRLYRSEGFHRALRRVALIRPLRPVREAS